MPQSRCLSFFEEDLSGFIVFEGQAKGRYYPIELSTFTVTEKPVKLIDFEGYIKYGLQHGDESLVIDYPDAVKFNIQQGSQIVLDGDSVIWSNTQNADATTRLPKRITCASCHKILDVPEVVCLPLVLPVGVVDTVFH